MSKNLDENDFMGVFILTLFLLIAPCVWRLVSVHDQAESKAEEIRKATTLMQQHFSQQKEEVLRLIAEKEHLQPNLKNRQEVFCAPYAFPLSEAEKDLKNAHCAVYYVDTYDKSKLYDKDSGREVKEVSVQVEEALGAVMAQVQNEQLQAQKQQKCQAPINAENQDFCYTVDMKMDENTEWANTLTIRSLRVESRQVTVAGVREGILLAFGSLIVAFAFAMAVCSYGSYVKKNQPTAN